VFDKIVVGKSVFRGKIAGRA